LETFDSSGKDKKLKKKKKRLKEKKRTCSKTKRPSGPEKRDDDTPGDSLLKRKGSGKDGEKGENKKKKLYLLNFGQKKIALCRTREKKKHKKGGAGKKGRERKKSPSTKNITNRFEVGSRKKKKKSEEGEKPSPDRGRTYLPVFKKHKKERDHPRSKEVPAKKKKPSRKCGRKEKTGKEEISSGGGQGLKSTFPYPYARLARNPRSPPLMKLNPHPRRDQRGRREGSPEKHGS